MTTQFQEKWLEAVDKKNSVLCAGLDPAEFEMGRGDKGLPEGVRKRDWALKYVEAVAPYCAALKLNLQYWQASGKIISGRFLEDDMEALEEIAKLADSLGLVVIEDKKLADIGDTNEAGMFYASKRAHAVTLALFAGNIAEAAKDLKSRGLGGIQMCIMSNPGYGREKNKLVPITKEDLPDYLPNDLIYANDIPYVRQYQQLAHDSRIWGLDGIVIGAPSPKNHIKDFEIEKARWYAGDKMLVLCPGVGAQGGEAVSLWKYFSRENVILNVGRDLMLPNGSNSTPEQQREKAKKYMEDLNKLRVANIECKMSYGVLIIDGQPISNIDGQPISRFSGDVYTNGTNFYAGGLPVKIQPTEGGLEGTLQENSRVLIRLDPEFVKEFGLDEAWEIAQHFDQQERSEHATNP